MKMKSKISKAVLALPILVLSACGSTGSSSFDGKTTDVKGVFYDEPVKGIEVYVNGKLCAVTDQEGRFVCKNALGKTLEFAIANGTIKLGKLKANSDMIDVTPINIAETGPQASLIIGVLRNCDDDGNTTNGLDITNCDYEDLKETICASSDDCNLSDIDNETEIDEILQDLYSNGTLTWENFVEDMQMQPLIAKTYLLREFISKNIGNTLKGKIGEENYWIRFESFNETSGSGKFTDSFGNGTFLVNKPLSFMELTAPVIYLQYENETMDKYLYLSNLTTKGMNGIYLQNPEPAEEVRVPMKKMMASAPITDSAPIIGEFYISKDGSRIPYNGITFDKYKNTFNSYPGSNIYAFNDKNFVSLITEVETYNSTNLNGTATTEFAIVSYYENFIQATYGETEESKFKLINSGNTPTYYEFSNRILSFSFIGTPEEESEEEGTEIVLARNDSHGFEFTFKPYMKITLPYVNEKTGRFVESGILFGDLNLTIGDKKITLKAIQLIGSTTIPE